MSGDGGVDIDLYADVEQDFPQEDFSNENNDLYDDVITASTSKDEEKEPSKAAVKKEEQERGDSQGSGSSSRPEGRRLVCLPPVNHTWSSSSTSFFVQVAAVCGQPDLVDH